MDDQNTVALWRIVLQNDTDVNAQITYVDVYAAQHSERITGVQWKPSFRWTLIYSKKPKIINAGVVMKKTLLFFVCFLVISIDSYAGRVPMNYPKICNGFSEYTGVVVDVIATTNYDGNENVYANLKLANGTYQGGVIYYRAPYRAGYIPMVNMVTMANITGVKTIFCMKKNGSDIYAVKITSE